MKKLNKKGNTLIELVISIALMSVILISIVRLLVDLNDTNTNNSYAKNNQINRAEILRAIENDLNSKVLVNINDSNSTTDKLIINFMFNDKTSSKIDVTKDSITYTSSNGDVRKWTMKDCELYLKKVKMSLINDDFSESIEDKIYTLQLDVEIHTNNEKNTEDNNNILDDILISYYGKVSDLDNDFLKTYQNSETCLGYCCQNNC